MVQFSRFASLDLCIQSRIPNKLGGFPHSDIAGSKLYCQLPHAFRRLTRPSSPIIAKASTWCTYSLDSIIWSTLLTWEVRRWLATFLKVSTLIKLTACCVWFLPFVFRNHSIQSSPKYCLIGFFLRRKILSSDGVHWGCNLNVLKPINIVFVCWFRLSNLLKIDAASKPSFCCVSSLRKSKRAGHYSSQPLEVN